MPVTAAEQLQEVFAIPDHRIDLGRAALVLAKLEYPELDVEAYVRQLDGFAQAIQPRLEGRYDPDRVIAGINEVLFERLGFHGNERDYYDPRNSFLNAVIDRRTGIPITLAVIYLEVARRLGLPFYGVGLPGHFLVKYDDNRQVIYVDPFHNGNVLDEQGCRDLICTLQGLRVSLSLRDFGAVDNRYIVIRMLNNLRSIYLKSRQFRKAIGVLDALLTLLPTSAGEFRQRGWLHLETGQWGRARQDLETYVFLRPDAEDAKDIKKSLEGIRASIAMMN